MRSVVTRLVNDPAFRRQARRFAWWFGQERRAVLELGKIAARWLRHYSRTRNAARLADALHAVTGIRVTGRSIMNYRDIYLLDCTWRRLGRAESRNRFKIRHVGPGHLRVVAGSRLPDRCKCDLLDEVERRRLRVQQTMALARQREADERRSCRRVRLPVDGPRVYHADAIDVLKRLGPGLIHHCMCDWQWQNAAPWDDDYAAAPVYRPADPVTHLCRLLAVVRPYLATTAIVWVFGRCTGYDGQIGLPHMVQRAASDAGLVYASEFIFQHAVSGYRSRNSFISVKHTPIHAYVSPGFDVRPITFMPSVSPPLVSPNHVSQRGRRNERHPYQKPIELFELLIRAGAPGGLVFDAFAGSGAAGVAAVRCGCPYVGAELQPQYARSANQVLAATVAERAGSTATG